MSATPEDPDSIRQRIDATLQQLQGAPNASPGCSDRRAVWQAGKAVLYRYLPLPGVRAARLPPLLICYALVNRPEVLDLQRDRSLIRRLLAAGLDVHLLDWGRPDESDRERTLADYLGDLDGAVHHVTLSARARAPNLLGVCQGGTLSLCYCALYPQRIANLVTMVTPVDFHTPADLLSKWARALDMQAIRRAGNLPGPALTALFLALRPFRLLQQKYVALLDQLRDPVALETFGRMERWIFDSPDQAATAAAEFVGWFYQDNRLVSGTLDLQGRRVSLRRIRRPILNVYATRDHIVPPEASQALRRHVGSTDYSELAVDTGHIGIYVGRESQQSVASRIVEWMQERP